MKKYQITKECMTKSLKFKYTNIEGTLIPITINGKKKILKLFYGNNKEYLENKLYTINLLEQLKELFDDRFILPEMLAVDNKKTGYIMRYVKNINFENYLKSYNVSLKQKIKYLKEMCLLLEECKRLRKTHDSLTNFYIGDLHVNNLLINTNTQELNICDMDSCSIGNNKPYCYKYLSCSKGLDRLNDKYINVNGKYIPNENSDLYCVIMVILDFLYDGPVETMNKHDFNEYLNYLDSVKDNNERLFDKNLLFIFSKIYERDNNINPYNYLDTLTEKALTRSNCVSYYYSKIKSY